MAMLQINHSLKVHILFLLFFNESMGLCHSICPHKCTFSVAYDIITDIEG